MVLLTPPSTSHRSEKENTAKFTFSLNEIPKLTVTTDPASSSTSPSSSSAASTSKSSLAASSSRSVIWSPHNSYHSLATPPKPRLSSAATNAMVKERPVKPILKRRRVNPPLSDATNGPKTANSDSLLNIPEDLDSFFRQRETTPEPSDPLCDLAYLEYPVSLILKPDAKLRELTEGYSILNARLRGTVQYTTDADASWPLFQPMRKNREKLVDCIIRDLERAFVDPVNSPDCPKGDDSIPDENWDDEEPADNVGTLPSPKKSPKRAKKKGMSAEQVKFARDLCTTAHAVIKLLCVMLCFPAIYGVFETIELRRMLGAVVSIPITGNLPTPNARKTCALAIMAIQCQRLPEAVLLPVRDRIAFALKRGIDGELGKEGKKGSANDGLKAIGDLCIFQPSTFVPVFSKAAVLPSILQNLLAPTLALRIQAAYALGGLAYSLAGLTPSNTHATAADMVAEFILTPSPSTPSRKNASPNKDSIVTSSAIMRTLRTTMNAQDAAHVGQSPVWALCVSASLIVLLGSKMYTDRKVCVAIMTIFKCGAKHKKAAIRHLFCAAWRAVSWAWFQPDYDLFKAEDESEAEGDGEQSDSEKLELKRKTREAYFQVFREILETQVALGTVAALLSTPPAPSSHLGIKEDVHDEALRRALEVIDWMANSPDPDTINEAASSLLNLVTPTVDNRDYTQPSEMLAENARALLPRPLFTQTPGNGVLFADVTLSGAGSNSVMAAVRKMFHNVPTVEEVRALRKEELRKDWVWKGMLKAWTSVLGSLEMTDDALLPNDLTQVWESLLVSNVSLLQDEGGDVPELASRVVDVLTNVFLDSGLNFTVKNQTSTSSVAFPSIGSKDREVTGTTLCTNAELKMKVVKSLWSTVKTVFPRSDLGAAADKLLRTLLENSGMLTEPRKKKVRSLSGNLNHVIAPITTWGDLCATIILDSGVSESTEAMKMFWGLGDESEAKCHWESLAVFDNCEAKSHVWKACLDVWKQEEGQWEGAVVLLAAPFVVGPSKSQDWSLSSEEVVKWKEFYQYASNKALDSGMDSTSTTVIDAVAGVVASHTTSSTSPALLIQASDLLLDHLEATEMREVPVNLVDLLNATLKTAYPVNERNVSPASWFIQTLTRVFETSPRDLIKDLVEGVGEAITVWLKDESEVWTDDTLDYTFVPLYQHLLLRIQELPTDLPFLATVSPLLDSVFSGRAFPEAVQNSFREAFDTFWKLSPYAQMEEPADGWPASLQHCLAHEQVQEVEVSVPVFEAPATPSRKVFKGDGASQPRTPMYPMNGSNIPSPRRPHRPHADTDEPFYPPLPVDRSPLSPVRRRRISSSSSLGEPRFSVSGLAASPFSRQGGFRNPDLLLSPSKRRRSLDHADEDEEMEKENASPQHATPKRRRTGLLSSARVGFDLSPIPIHERIASVGKAGNSSVPTTGKKLKLKERMGKNKNGMTPAAKRPKLFGRTKSPSPARSEGSSQGSSDDSEDERGWVERELVPFPSLGGEDEKEDGATVPDEPAGSARSSASEEKAEPQTPSKKRKRMFMDSVLIPPLACLGNTNPTPSSSIPSASELLVEIGRARSKRKLSHSASFDSSTAGNATGGSSGTTELWSTPSMRRSATAPIPATALVMRSGAGLMRQARRYRMRTESDSGVGNADDEDPFEAEVRTTEPLPALKIPGPSVVVKAPQVNSDPPSSDGPSSDDSLHLGQVTPHHLISPHLAARTTEVYGTAASRVSALSFTGRSGTKMSATSQILARGRRVSVDSMPGSDDSIGGGAPDSSPTRNVVARRNLLGFGLQRRASSLGLSSVKRA
ncbi:hypothetical protein CC1G_05040 [Coprinopsis cinerea okayama7|uniref:Telomere-associated protein Rif1 N-terminal domain-containing protein n=1 Tax=Coprinopsis cinerea (strain Okayama-7 / 130 / ATCC MYA-4618 / FGSC 9003) TaxID=240176 RepID=A8NSN0_COPC7|nr:hypothetical protein CC1G_05040 [Coprinopsis cinerea okayama7\|eukprot:XP_001836047.1 hypothetical protein CC1G_05040 [Coprinopsis cinerea okayama7\